MWVTLPCRWANIWKKYSWETRGCGQWSEEADLRGGSGTNRWALRFLSVLSIMKYSIWLSQIQFEKNCQGIDRTWYSCLKVFFLYNMYCVHPLYTPPSLRVFPDSLFNKPYFITADTSRIPIPFFFFQTLVCFTGCCWWSVAGPTPVMQWRFSVCPFSCQQHSVIWH